MSAHLLSPAWRVSLPTAGKVVLLKLVDQANDQGVVWLATSTIMRDTGLSERGVQKWIKIFRTCGALELLDRAPVKWHVRSNVYRINMTRFQEEWPAAKDGAPCAPQEQGDGAPRAPHDESEGAPCAPQQDGDGAPRAPHPRTTCPQHLIDPETNRGARAPVHARDDDETATGGRGTGAAGAHFRACEQQIRSAIGDGVWRSWFRGSDGGWHVVVEVDDGARLVLSAINDLWVGQVRQHAQAIADVTARGVVVIMLRDQDRAAWHARRARALIELPAPTWPTTGRPIAAAEVAT